MADGRTVERICVLCRERDLTYVEERQVGGRPAHAFAPRGRPEARVVVMEEDLPQPPPSPPPP